MPLVKNAIPDAAGAIRRRPGFGIDGRYGFAGGQNVESAIIGMAPFKNWLVFVTAQRRIYAIDTTPTNYTLISLTTDADLDTFLAGSGRPSIVATRSKVLIAGGAQIQVWDGVTARSYRLPNTGNPNPSDPGYVAPTYPPPDGAFIAAVAQRLVVQPGDTSGTIHWSGPLENYENWDYALGGAQYTQAAAKPDPVVAMLDNTNEVFAFGKETIQVFTFNDLSIDQLDTSNSLDLSPSRTQNIGTISPYSIVAVDDNFALLDRHRRFILTDGRTYQDVSHPVSQLLRDLTRIDDCWGFRMRFGRFDCVVWFFPTDGFGLVYDTKTQKWSEWTTGMWSGPGVSISYPGLPGQSDTLQPGATITSAYNWAEKSIFVVGTSCGQLLALDDGSPTDGYANMACPINVEVQSGFTDHDTQAQKHCRTLMLKFKRTTRKYPDDPLNIRRAASGHVRISKRDDQGAWKVVKDVELSRASSDPTSISDVAPSSPCIQIRSLGVYRARQWKVEYTGTDEIQLVGAQEEYEVLGA
jgi:hypothetical protein